MLTASRPRGAPLDWDRMPWTARRKWLAEHEAPPRSSTRQAQSAARPRTVDGKGRPVWTVAEMRAAGTAARYARAGKGPALTPDQRDAALAYGRRQSKQSKDRVRASRVVVELRDLRDVQRRRALASKRRRVRYRAEGRAVQDAAALILAGLPCEPAGLVAARRAVLEALEDGPSAEEILAGLPPDPAAAEHRRVLLAALTGCDVSLAENITSGENDSREESPHASVTVTR